MAIAGIDMGTTGCKCSIYSVEGVFLSGAYEEYDTKNEAAGEVSAWTVWQSVKDVLKRAASGCREDISAIGVTSFGEATVIADNAGKPLMPSVLCTDKRGESECEKLVERFGRRYICETTGIAPHSMYSIAKLMWTTENKPDILERANHIFLFQDYIVFMLSGAAQIDYTLACRTMMFNPDGLCWAEQILDFAGIDKSKLSEPVRTGSRAGRILPKIAEELGISKYAEVISCCHDQIAAAIGTGCLDKGMAVDGTGTVECITPVFGKLKDNNALYDNNYVLIPYIYPDTFVTYAFSFNGGSLLKWYRDMLARMETAECVRNKQNAYDYFNSQMDTSKPSGLLLLPYFSGAATPYMDNSATGALVGLTLDTTSIDIYHALMEGVTYEMLLNQERLEKSGITVSEFRATGGGAKAVAWLQLKADILNKPVISLGEAQSGTLGSIMLSGLACGIYADINEAAEVFVKTEKTYEPDLKKNELYHEYYNKYKKLYCALKEVLD